MARARNIKPGFFKNEELGGMPFGARLLFVGLWTLADRDGRLEDRPARIAGELFPYDREVGASDVDLWLQGLADSAEGFIVRYAIGKTRYLQISNFGKHQFPHFKEQASVIPAPENTLGMPETSPGQTSGMHLPKSGKPELSLDEHLPGQCVASPSSLNPSTPINLSLLTGAQTAPETAIAPVPQKAPRVRKLTGGQDPAAVEWFHSEFWPLYPRKDDKEAALKTALKHGATETDRAAITAKLHADLPELSVRERQFISLPASWLNKRRWRDGPVEVPAPKLNGFQSAGQKNELSRYIAR
jgi:hypothetical protein